MADLPYGMVKRKLVCSEVVRYLSGLRCDCVQADGKAEPCFVTQQLGEGDITPAKEDVIKWAATSIYGGGADTTVSAVHTFFLAMTLYPDIQVHPVYSSPSILSLDCPHETDTDSYNPWRAEKSPGGNRYSRGPRPLANFGRPAPATVRHGANERGFPLEPGGAARHPSRNYARRRLPRLSHSEGLSCDPECLVSLKHCFRQSQSHNTRFMANNPEIYKSPRVFNPDRFIDTPGHPAEPDPHNVVFGFGRR